MAKLKILKDPITGESFYPYTHEKAITDDNGNEVIAAIKDDLVNLKGDLSNKITKFYASNQGETHITDSDNGKIQDMMIYGMSEQKQYSGKNLLELSDNQVQKENLKIQINQGIITFSGTVNNQNFIKEIDSFTVPSDGTYTISTNSNSNTDSPRILITINDGPYLSAFNGATKELNAGDVVRLYIRISSVGSYDGVTIKPMIEKGSKVTSYEPYSGGIPSPSPDYPQEIKSVVNPTIKLLESNILKIADGEYQKGGVTATVSNGVVKLKGTANSYVDIFLTANSKITFKEGTKIIFNPNNVKGIESKNGSYLDFSNNTTVGFSINNKNINTPYIIKERDTKYPFILFIRCNAGENYDVTWKPQVLIGETITPFKPYTEQTITLPITLNAIPVSSGGNVTINGQQYIADYVDVERGKIVQMVQRQKLMDIININIKMKSFDEYIFDCADSKKFRADIVGIINIANFNDISGSNTNASRGVFAVGWGKIYLRVSKMVLPQTIEDMKKWLNNNDLYCILPLQSPIETDLTTEQIQALKELVTYYPVTNISVNSEHVEGYTIFNYPISMANGWNYVKQQLNDNRDYIYDMDLQSAEAYVNSEYAVTLTELEV